MMDEKRFKINKESIDRLFPKTDPILDYLTSTGYKSPITTFVERINADLRSEELKEVMRATVRLGVEVDKEELLKALRYDRKQYEKGLADGCRHNVDELRREVEKNTAEAIRAALHANRSSRDGITFKLVDLETIDRVIDEFLKEY